MKIKKLNLYQKLISFLLKKGKKNKAKKILDLSLLLLSFIFKKPVYFIINTFFFKLNVYIETKTIKVKRSRYIVPVPINLKRRIYLITHWFVSILIKNNEKTVFYKKIVKEIFLIIKNLNSEVLKLKHSNHTKALLNRSNIHYRW